MGILWNLICHPKYTQESFGEHGSLQPVPIVVAFLQENYLPILQSRGSRIQERQLGSTTVVLEQTQERNQHEMHGGFGHFKSQQGTPPTACTVYQVSVNIKQKQVRRKNILGSMVHS